MDELTRTDATTVAYPGPPAWSGDGEYLATQITEPDGEVLQFYTAAGEAAWRLSPADGLEAYTWLPSGHQAIVRTTDRTLRVDPAAKSTTVLARGDETAHTVSNDGSHVAYFADGELTVRALETGQTTRFEGPTAGAYLGGAERIAWAPDDEAIAVRFVEDRSKRVGVFDRSSGKLRYRTPPGHPAAVQRPVWLDADTLLVTAVADHATRRAIVAVEPATGDRTALLEETDELGAVSSVPPVVAPGGGRAATVFPADGWAHVHCIEDETVTQLTAGAFEAKGLNSAAPVWIDAATLVVATNREHPEQRRLERVDVPTGTAEALVDVPGTSVHPAVGPDGDRLAYIHADTTAGPELRVRALDAAPGDPGTVGTPSAVREWPVDPIAPERITLPVEEYEVPAFVLDPRGEAVSADAADLPAIVYVHGGPMRQMRRGWHPTRSYALAYTFQQYLAHQGALAVLPNYRGGIGYGTAFRQGIAADPGEEVDTDVVAAAQWCRDQDVVDPDRVAVWGLSYGGYATLRVLGNDPEAFDLGVNLAGVADRRQYEAWATTTKYAPAESSLPTTLGGTRWEAPEAWAAASPIEQLSNRTSPLVSFHGTADRYVDVEQQDRVVEACLGTDTRFDFEYYPGESHTFRSGAVWRRVISHLETALFEELAPGE